MFANVDRGRNKFEKQVLSVGDSACITMYENAIWMAGENDTTGKKMHEMCTRFDMSLVT